MIARIAELRAEFGRTGSFDIGLVPRERRGFGSTDGTEAYIDAIGALLASTISAAC